MHALEVYSLKDMNVVRYSHNDYSLGPLSCTAIGSCMHAYDCEDRSDCVMELLAGKNGVGYIEPLILFNYK